MESAYQQSLQEFVAGWNQKKQVAVDSAGKVGTRVSFPLQLGTEMVDLLTQVPGPTRFSILVLRVAA